MRVALCSNGEETLLEERYQATIQRDGKRELQQKHKWIRVRDDQTPSWCSEQRPYKTVDAARSH